MCCDCGCGLKRRFHAWLLRLVEKRYPGVRDIVSLMDRVRENVETGEIAGLTDDSKEKVALEQLADKKEDGEAGPSEIFQPEDGKWRPVLFTLGLIHKLQKVTDDGWYDAESTFVTDKKKVNKYGCVQELRSTF